MAKYILLECNRLRGKQTFNNLSDESDKYKNNWTNIVSTTGIVVNAGDTISLEQIILNSKGASDDVIEFLGEENEEGFLDNKCDLEYSFYINHSGQNTARMPFINHKVYRGGGTIINPNYLGTGDSYYWEFNNAPANQSYSLDNMKSQLSRRSLGETYFPKPNRPSDNTKEWNTDSSYDIINDYYMNGSMITRMKTIQTGGGQSGVADSGYVAGGLYNVRYKSGSSGLGTGMIIRIEGVTTSGEIGGIVTSWSMYNVGRNYDKSGSSAPNLELFSDSHGNNVVGTLHTFTLYCFTEAETYSSSGLRGFDGSRFSFINSGYSGMASEIEGEALNTNLIDTATIIDTADKRKKKINLNIDEGFMTPDNLGAILTDQLHEPSPINGVNDENADYLDYKTLQFLHRTPNGNFSSVSKPIIVATPTYQPQPCNMIQQGIPNTRATLIGARRGFYQHIAYKYADRFIGLKNAFWNFNFVDSDFSRDVDITTGAIDSQTLDSTRGDFGNLRTGDLGVRVCLLNQLEEDGNSDTAFLEKYGLIMTNMRWTKSNIERLKTGLKKAEYYLGDTTKEIDVSSDDYKQSLAVNIDLGLYDDEESSQFPLALAGNPLSIFVGQRTQFAWNKVGARVAVNSMEVPVDFSWYNNYHRPCKSSTIRNFPASIDNDGQELPSMWIKSRWQDGFTYSNTIDPTYQGNKLNLNFMNYNADQEFNTNRATFSERDFFIGSWKDKDGNTQTTDTAIQDAIDADLAIVPIFPQDYSVGKFGIDTGLLAKDLQPPYICFVNAMAIGNQDNPTTTFDYSNLGNDNNKWTIDFWNVDFGCPLGLDHSFTRNEAVCLVSPMFGNEIPQILENYMNVAYIGAVNPSFTFNPQLSRFEISGLNTPQNIGNGLLTDIPETIEANPNPEQTCFKILRTGNICNTWEKITGNNIPSGSSQDDGVLISQFDDAQQDEGSLMDSQSGIAIEGIYLYDKNGNTTQLQNTDIGKYKGTLFEKMGFNLNQLLPDFGDANAFFTNQFTFQSVNPTYGRGLISITKPVTTGSYISSAEIQTTSLNELNMPMYDLGVSATRQATPDASEGAITAFKLADKLSFPYFCVYSSIPSAGTDTEWVGGDDGHSNLPCMGYLTRENNIGDFYYNAQQSFEYTAIKDFTLTEVETDIRLPDGSKPRFEGHSAVIYKITKPLTSLPAPLLQPTKAKGKGKKK